MAEDAAPAPEPEQDADPAACCDERAADAELLHFEWDNGDRWGSEGWYMRPHDYRRPLCCVTFCPFCGKRFAP